MLLFPYNACRMQISELAYFKIDRNKNTNDTIGCIGTEKFCGYKRTITESDWIRGDIGWNNRVGERIQRGLLYCLLYILNH